MYVHSSGFERQLPCNGSPRVVRERAELHKRSFCEQRQQPQQHHRTLILGIFEESLIELLRN